jgi:thiol:disulfide interchange protein
MSQHPCRRHSRVSPLAALTALWALGLVAASASAQSAQAPETVAAPHARVSWLVPQAFGDSGQAVEHIGVLFEPEAGWHFYWKNPGDSGTAPKVALTVQGGSVGEAQWPPPVRIPAGPLTNFGYDGAIALLLPVTDIAGDTLEVEAKVEWLVCAAEECVPGFATLSFQRPTQAGASSWDPKTQATVRKFHAQLPQPLAASTPWQVAGVTDEGTLLRVSLKGPSDKPVPEVFPVDVEVVQAAAPRVESTAAGAVVSFTRAPGYKVLSTFALLLKDGPRAFEGSVPVAHATAMVASLSMPTPAPALSVPQKPTTPELPPLWVLLASAFLGGVILNLMPCVLPVLSIKFMSFAQTESGGRMKDALAYTAGVITTFAALGAVVVVLGALGSRVGWGFQLQSPVIVFGLAVLFFTMALNFLGVFEMGFFAMNLAGNAKVTSAFSTGVLSVFVAAPCTGPFMGTALGATAVLPAWAAMSIFIALGAGLASPFVLLALSPKLVAKVPRPGRWMERLKQFFAFPLLLTVLWLAWVLGAQTGSDGWLWLLLGLFVVAFALWLGKQGERLMPIAGWTVAVVGLVGSGYGVTQAQEAPPAAAMATTSARPGAAPMFGAFDPVAIEAARKRGQPVFVDFTAKWCITCQVNKKAVLATAEGHALFEKHGVLTMEADWTNEDAVITEALAAFGRNSVPLYVYYPKGGGEPRILPQTLTLTIVEEHLTR